MATYISWIPTVSGALSFELVGRSSGPFPFKIILKDERLNIPRVVYQKRIPPDVKLPFMWLIPARKARLIFSSWALYKLRGHRFIENFWIVFDIENYLKHKYPKKIRGVVIISPRISKMDIDSISKMIKSRGWKIDSNSEIRKIFFSIYRNGKILIRCLEGIDINSEKEISEICYRCVKDVFHVHKHHDEYEDNIIQVYRQEIKSEQSWGYNVVRSMLRYIIRNRNEPGYRILGIIPYLKSIIKICHNEDKPANYPSDIEIGNLESSIKYSKDEDNYRLISDRWLYGSILAIFMFVVNFHKDEIKNVSHIIYFISLFFIFIFMLSFWRRISVKDYIISMAYMIIEDVFYIAKIIHDLGILPKYFSVRRISSLIFISISLLFLLLVYILLY